MLVTGAAGFIGAAVCERLLARGERVIGLDNLNPYYDPTLKQARLARLKGRTGFRFEQLDLADRADIEALFARAKFERVLAANVITRDSVAQLFRIAPSRISDFVVFPPANAIKFTLYRTRPSGSPGDWDILGCQQYGPLLDVEIPD